MPQVLVDGRPAAAPILGSNAFDTMPILPLDLHRIEVTRGSGAPLYGPESTGGVTQFFTRGPFQHPGTSASLAGGSRSFFDAQFRRAGAIDGTVGYKISGQFSRANEWALDPDDSRDAEEIARYRTFGPGENLPTDRTVVDRQLRRDDRYRKYNVNGLLRYRFGDALSLSLRSGYTSLTSTLQTGLGTIQADELGFAYGDLRLEAGSFLAQVGVKGTLDEGDSYLLRTGNSVLDEGTQWIGRVQYDTRASPRWTHISLLEPISPSPDPKRVRPPSWSKREIDSGGLVHTFRRRRPLRPALPFHWAHGWTTMTGRRRPRLLRGAPSSLTFSRGTPSEQATRGPFRFRGRIPSSWPVVSTRIRLKKRRDKP